MTTKQHNMMIQTGLAGLGYAPGPADGLYGPRTRAAAEAWLAAGGQAAQTAVAPETTATLYQGSARYPVSEIAVHCSDTRPGWLEKEGLRAQIAEIRRWHMDERRWMDIGYHWLIGRSGDILPGRPETVIGAGIEDHNRGVIHICLIGGHGSAATDAFARHFTPQQDISLRQLMQGITMRSRITRISGHNEWAAKACPGFSVPRWLQEAV